MKNIYFLASLISLLILVSCTSVNVYSDYDKETDFSEFKTYAFYKKGIDKVEISDLDKKRILRAIEKELKLKGLVPSENPDLLVNIFTKSREKIDVYNNNYYGWYPWYYGYGYGYGYGPGYGPGYGFGKDLNCFAFTPDINSVLFWNLKPLPTRQEE